MSGTVGSVLGGPFGSPGAPGFLSPFDIGAVGAGEGQSLTAMANRYNQLGMGGSTPEAMDLGAAPSYTGGIPQQFQAVLGQVQNAQSGQIGGKGTSPASLIGAAAGLSGK